MKTIETTKNVTFNEEQGLFCIPCNGGGYSCLGLEVCRERAARLSGELGESLPEDYRAKRFESPLALYADYRRMVDIVKAKNDATGFRSQIELTPELCGLEGKRVEVTHEWESGQRETVRFQVGKSTGWIPCHLALHNRNSRGGGAVCLGKIKSVRIIAR